MGFTEHLRARGVDGLVALLGLRPDLAAPPPASVRALAARATSRASLDRCLAQADAAVLAVLDAVVALEGPTTGPVTAHRLSTAVGTDVAAALDRTAALALVWEDDGGLHAAPGLAEALGPHPAGLGPPLVATLTRRSSAALSALADALGVDSHVDALASRLADRAVVDELLGQAPPGASAVLDALTWGPPVGRSPAAGSPAHAAVAWLLRHGLLALGDSQHVLLPREVGLALRDGRVVAAAPHPPEPGGEPVPPASVEADAAQHALEAVRLVGAVVDAWGAEPPAVLRAGGLGVRELRRLAGRLGVTEAETATLVEVAGAVGLVVDDGEDPPSFRPTTAADDWAALPESRRWSDLVAAWLPAERAPWLVGTRDEKGAVRGALDPASRRPWVPRLRAAVLGVLAEAGARRPSAEEVHAVLAWRSPRSAPTPHAVAAVLDEARLLGLTGAGALCAAGLAALRARVAAAGQDDGALGGPLPAGAAGASGGPGGADPAEVLALHLPPAVNEVLLGGDLTGIVPGRPTTDLAALLESAATVESRGGGLTVRFTEASVRAALDTGRTAEDLLAALGSHARSGVPQPLEYLVLDTARRHGQVRAGLASSYVRGEAAALAGLPSDPALRSLGLQLLAPTVLTAQVSPATLVAALRDRGVPAVVEDAQGRLVAAGSQAHRVRLRRRPAAPAASAVPAAEARGRRLRRVAADLLAGRESDPAAISPAPGAGGPAAEGQGPLAPRTGGAADSPGAAGVPRLPVLPPGTADPSLVLAVLRDAVAAGQEVWLEVAGPDGPMRRRVRPLRVDAGRVRAVDPERESELTVAVHRIATVTPVGEA